MKLSMKEEFARCLCGGGILFALQQGISIPYQLLSAMLTAGMVTSAVAGEISAVLWQGGFLIGCVILYKLLETILKICCKKQLIVATQDCRMRLYGWYMQNPLDKLYSFQQGDFLERVTNDFSAVVGKFSKWIPLLVINLLASVIYFLYVGMQSWILALLFVILAAVQIVPELAIKRLEEMVYEENRDVEAEITEWSIAAYRGFSTIKSLNLGEWYMERLKKLHDENVAIGSRASGISATESSIQQLISYLLKYGACVGAGLFVLWGKLSLEVAITTIAISGSFFSSVKMLFTAIPEFAVVNVAQRRLEEWKAQSEDKRRLMKETGIRFVDVSFSYGEKQIFCHKSETLEIDGIGIIKGENGCGKSTLLKLIAGLLSYEDGYIAVGKDVADTQEQLWEGQKILYLSQERLGMDITAEEYIRLFSELDEQTLKDNLCDFHIGEELLHSSMNHLSGGEEKKIMLSILLATKAPLLLLDEPETSLDVDGQNILAQKLKERGHGVLLITHAEKFDSIANRIYQMKSNVSKQKQLRKEQK